MLDYKLVEAVVAVAEAGGFARAAGVLHLTQSAVSQRVRLLEDQMGQVLVARTTPPLLTDAGKRLLRHYREVQRLEAELEDAVVPTATDRPTAIPVAVNVDSLATWFLAAVQPFLRRRRAVLQLVVDDQEETLVRLKNGEAMGCVSAKATPVQGCRAEPLGAMTYRLVASADFAHRWFPGGLTEDAVAHAPAVLFGVADRLHARLLDAALPGATMAEPPHYVPSLESFIELITGGLAYGMLLESQAAQGLRRGELVDLAPQHPLTVPLYWHRWNLRSEVLDELTAHVLGAADRLADLK